MPLQSPTAVEQGCFTLRHDSVLKSSVRNSRVLLPDDYADLENWRAENNPHLRYSTFYQPRYCHSHAESLSCSNWQYHSNSVSGRSRKQHKSNTSSFSVTWRTKVGLPLWHHRDQITWHALPSCHGLLYTSRFISKCCRSVHLMLTPCRLPWHIILSRRFIAL